MVKIQLFKAKGQIFKAIEIIQWPMGVYIGERSQHPGGESFVVRSTQERIQPNKPVAVALQPGDLLGEQIGFATVKPIAEQEYLAFLNSNPMIPAL